MRLHGLDAEFLRHGPGSVAGGLTTCRSTGNPRVRLLLGDAMRRFFLSLGLAIAAQVQPGFSLADSDLTGSRWTVVVAEQCQLGQIEEIQLQAGGIARGTALVESSNSSGTAGENS